MMAKYFQMSTYSMHKHTTDLLSSDAQEFLLITEGSLSVYGTEDQTLCGHTLGELSHCCELRRACTHHEAPCRTVRGS